MNVLIDFVLKKDVENNGTMRTVKAISLHAEGIDFYKLLNGTGIWVVYNPKSAITYVYNPKTADSSFTPSV